MIGAASGAYTVSRERSTIAHRPRPRRRDRGPAPAVRHRAGRRRFVEDLKKAGFSEEQAKKAQSEIKARFDRLRNDPTSLPDVARDVANNPSVREAAGRAAEGARQATWWTLVGMIISMATVIFGSLIGSGELLQPVPILGVRVGRRPPLSRRGTRSHPRPALTNLTLFRATSLFTH